MCKTHSTPNRRACTRTVALIAPFGVRFAKPEFRAEKRLKINLCVQRSIDRVNA